VNSHGLLVTLEGGEGAGKSTQIARLAERTRELGREVVTCREPGGTEVGEHLRNALFGLTHAPTALTELLTFSAARAELVATVIQPALERGALVLCDRFIDSTIAYQGYGRGLNIDTIEVINEIATGGLEPDLTLLFDISPSRGRARGAEGGTDYLEREELTFHERVREGFRTLAHADRDRWIILDAALPVDEVTENAWSALRRFLMA
jgi:dTMP kinase